MLLMFGLGAQAQPAKVIDFLYIHGAYEEGEDYFAGAVNKMQPEMKKAFEQNPTIQTHLLKNGEYEINPQGQYLYWGNDSLENMKTVDKGLDISKLVSPLLAQITREGIAHLLHDSIWIQQFQNMKPIIYSLNDKIKSQYNEKGESFVIFGYSAGTFVAYQYLLNSLPYVDLVELAKTSDFNLKPEQQKLIQQINPKPTCLNAILESEIAFLTIDERLVKNPNDTNYRTNFRKLDDFTDKFCTPPNSVKGAVVFGSPLLIFYSNIPETGSKLNALNFLLVKYMIENGMFFLAANYREDPLALPRGKNDTFAELKATPFFADTKKGGGFVFDESDIKSGKTVITAHTSYWETQKRFSKAVAGAFEKGYKYFYGL